MPYSLHPNFKLLTGYEHLFLHYLTSFDYFEERMVQLMGEIISRHGKDEWKAVTLTHELHGHVGIYSILGAKMGTLAMELFQLGKKKLSVISFAGFHPPISCMNDGLQASIGATVGNNLLTIDHADQPRIGAAFTHGGKKIEVNLKQEIIDRLAEELSHAPGRPSEANGPYWRYVEKLALKYWLEWDRALVFEWRHL